MRRLGGISFAWLIALVVLHGSIAFAQPTSPEQPTEPQAEMRQASGFNDASTPRMLAQPSGSDSHRESMRGPEDSRARRPIPGGQDRTPYRWSFTILLGLGLILVLLDRRPGLPLESAPRVGPPALGTWALGLAFGVVLLVASPYPPVQSDTLRDLTLALECASGGACLGPPTSFRGMQQGAGWTRLLAWYSTLRGAPSLVTAVHVSHVVTIVIHALSFVFFLNEAQRWLKRGAALAASVLFGAIMLEVVEFPIQNNPTLSSLPMVTFFTGVALLVAERRTRWAVLAASSLALLLETHPLNAILAPQLLFASAAFAATPLRAVALSATIPLGTSWLLGERALVTNIDSLLSMGMFAPLLAACALPIALGLAVQSHLSQLPQRRRVAVVLFGISGLSLGAPLILALITGQSLVGPYILSAMVGVPVLLSPLLRSLPSRPRVGRVVHALIALVAVASVLLVAADTRMSVTYAELKPLTNAIYARGESWDSIPNLLESPEDPSREDGNRWTPKAKPIRLESDSPRLLLVRESDWETLSIDRPWRKRRIGRGMLLLYSKLDRWVAPAPVPGSTPRRLTFPIRPRDADEGLVRHLQVPAPLDDDWHIVAVEGVEYLGTLPSDEIILVQKRPTEGVLVLEALDAEEPECDPEEGAEEEAVGAETPERDALEGEPQDDEEPECEAPDDESTEVPPPVLFEITDEEHDFLDPLLESHPNAFVAAG